ncbi:MAG: hypothetical protein IJW19_06355 [Clostridia bacterium]|nr:hypothetical protein [Clostridia bacterium]
MMGVDLSSSPVNVSKNRASYMKNMISEGGTNHKRHGFTAVAQYLDINDMPLRINGMHIYGDKLIIHAGNAFYIDGERIPSDRNIRDSKSQSFYINGKLFIVGCGDILVYDGDRIKGIEPYIPLVMTSADYRFNSTKTIEAVNMLTPERTAKYDGTVYSDDAVGIFNFDPSTDFTSDVIINVKISASTNIILLKEGGIANPETDGRWLSDIDVSFRITPDIVEANSVDGAVKAFSIEADLLVDGKIPYIYDEKGMDIDTMCRRIELSVIFDCSKFQFSFNPTPTEEGYLNIELHYNGKTNNAQKIAGCTFGTLVGDDNNTTRLIVSGHKEYPNMCYISDSFHMEGCAYFPDINYIAVGDSKPVTAFARLSDSSLAIFKQKEFFRYELAFFADPETFVTKLQTTGFKGADTVGCINPYVAVNVNSDSLVFTGENICAVADSSTNSSIVKYLKVRSSRVEKSFRKYTKDQLKIANACEFNGRYYLFIAGDVYIGDTRYKSYIDNKLDGSFEYEWWVWDRVNARCAINYENRLYIGTETGQILHENDEYRDIDIVKITRQGDVLYEPDNGSFTINGEISIGENTRVRINDEETEYYLDFEKGKYFIKDAEGNIIKPDIPDGTEPTLAIFNTNNVCAVYHTPMLNMGTTVQTKTLYKIAITAGISDLGHIKVGYETNKSDMLTMHGESGFDFNKLNFNLFTLDMNFAKTYAIRVYERNFNYIMIRLESDENKDMSVEGISLIYVINNLITGVR